MQKYILSQIKILDKLNINYHSINLYLQWNKTKDKYDKKVLEMPIYRNKLVETKYIKTKNGTIIFLGERYNLIGVDVDNKNDTINFFNELAFDNEFDLNTFTIKTINDGYHYYFRLSDEQKELLKNFCASTGECYTTDKQERNIDIKYNNQLFYGPSQVDVDGQIFKYEIITETPPIILPDYLFNEILKTHKKSKNKEKNIIKTTKIKDYKNNSKEYNSIDYRLTIYLDLLNHKRFDNRDDWLTIGAIIFNEGGTLRLFDDYSKKSEKYNIKCCGQMWESYDDDRDKKAGFNRLYEMVEEDNKDNHDLLKLTILKDKARIFEQLFMHGSSDTYLSYLFYHFYSNKFIYDNINKSWYPINQYNIYEVDKEGINILRQIDKCLLDEIRKEYYRLTIESDKNNNNPNIKKELFSKYHGLYKYCTSARNSKNMLDKLKLLFTVDKIYEIMDNINPNLLGFTNGVYDLAGNIFRIVNQKEYISVTTGYEYNKANSKLKDKAMDILKSIMPDEEELRFLLKHISLGLFGGNPEEQFYIYIGTSGNGKGIIRDIIQMVLGDYYDTMDITYLYKSTIIRPEAPNTVMARKKNSRMVISTEPEGDVVLKSSTIKNVSGNDPQQVRELYGVSFNFIPKFKLIIQTNTEPTFHAFDGGMRRRLALINFPNKFVENPVLPNERKIDKTLKKKITIDKLYRYEFLEILIEHYKLYLEEGLLMPKRIKEDTEKCIKNNDPVGEWFNANINRTNNDKDIIKASKLYENYIDFMDDDNGGISQLMFKNLLSSYGINQKKKSDGNYFVGIKFKVFRKVK